MKATFVPKLTHFGRDVAATSWLSTGRLCIVHPCSTCCSANRVQAPKENDWGQSLTQLSREKRETLLTVDRVDQNSTQSLVVALDRLLLMELLGISTHIS